MLTRTPFDALPGLTANQQAIGHGLEQGYGLDLASGAGTAFYTTLLTNQITPGEVAAAYDALGGEGVTGSQQTTFAAASRFVEAMREQGAFWLSAGPQVANLAALGDPPDVVSTRLGAGRVWVSASGAGANLRSDSALGAAALSTRSWGRAAGIEFATSPNILIGLAGGGSGSSFSVSERGSNGSVGGGQLGIYALARSDGAYASGAFAWGHYGVGTTRSVSAFGLTGTNTGSFDTSVLTSRIEAGYVAETMFANVTPFAALESSWLNLPSFVETPAAAGSPLLALNFSGKTATSVPTSLGLQLDRTAILENGWSVAPYFRAAWLHEWNTTRSISADLLAAPGGFFGVAGSPASRNAARLTGSVKLAQAERFALFADVTADLSGRGQAVAGNISVKLSW